ncbi:hypothetical protein HMPREF0185_02432 [Brevundimonas diminuta 470-4]|nr:hypothetical protein HMPREF0185_02432 [Brevundimonas diminuta 470-4]
MGVDFAHDKPAVGRSAARIQKTFQDQEDGWSGTIDQTRPRRKTNQPP